MSQFPDQNLPQLLFTVNRFCRAIQIVGRSKSYASITELQKKLAIAELEGIEVGDMNAGVDDGKGDISLTHGENPKVLNFKGFMDEADAICERVEQLEAVGTDLSSICVVARTKNFRDSYAEVLKEAGINNYEIMVSGAGNRKVEGVRIATMHRVKGLEFQHLFVAGVNEDKLPLMNFKSNDPVEIREDEMAERALLHVAMTRAMKSLTVTSHGTPSSFIRR